LYIESYSKIAEQKSLTSDWVASRAELLWSATMWTCLFFTSKFQTLMMRAISISRRLHCCCSCCNFARLPSVQRRLSTCARKNPDRYSRIIS